MNCPTCAVEMKSGFLYVRGLGGALFWSESAETKVFSRKSLTQIDLRKISKVPTGGQAIVPAHHCAPCGLMTFKTGPG